MFCVSLLLAQNNLVRSIRTETEGFQVHFNGGKMQNKVENSSNLKYQPSNILVDSPSFSGTILFQCAELHIFIL